MTPFQEYFALKLLPTFEALKVKYEAERPECKVTIDDFNGTQRFVIHGETPEGNYGAMIAIVDLDRNGDRACSIEQYGSFGFELLYHSPFIRYLPVTQILGELIEGSVRAMMGDIDRKRARARTKRAQDSKNNKR